MKFLRLLFNVIGSVAIIIVGVVMMRNKKKAVYWYRDVCLQIAAFGSFINSDRWVLQGINKVDKNNFTRQNCIKTREPA